MLFSSFRLSPVARMCTGGFGTSLRSVRRERECAQASHPELYNQLDRAVRAWRDSWRVGAPPPALSLTAGDDGYYTLMDTRDLEGTDLFQFLAEEEAHTVLLGGPLDR